MDERCAECGFHETDYATRAERAWLARALPERAALTFEQLPAGAAVAGFPDEASLCHHLEGLFARQQLHEAVHLAQLASNEAARLGLGLGFALEGRIVGIHTSEGGVPKLPRKEAEVGFRGVLGDTQRHRRHHGHAWQALCLWSDEVIGQLAAEGNPIGPGKAGENLTVAGLDWSLLRSGLVFEIGEVVCELTGPATPCKENKGWFLDGDFRRIDHDRHPGSSRWYAAVRRPGRIRSGDPVQVGVPSPSAARS